ncbi:glycoside hydrolase superfamily [Mycena leptocephala]|nr:glycoside hydrolase superfamily [Mycena leptocephala]
MTAPQRQEYKDAGITVLVSLFGWFAKPTSSNWDPATTANMMAAWVKANGVDGIDVDYEDTAAMAAGKAEAWVITLTTQLKNQLGAGYILTHAPMAPWWGPASGDFPNGGYRKIDQSVGSMIDWYNVQFYNSGTKYEDCTSLVQQAPDQTAALQINSEAKVPLNKIVIGKPLSPADGGTYTDMPTLSSCLQTAKAAGWDAGISFWKYADNATEAMTEARNPAFQFSSNKVAA